MTSLFRCYSLVLVNMICTREFVQKTILKAQNLWLRTRWFITSDIISCIIVEFSVLLYTRSSDFLRILLILRKIVIFCFSLSLSALSVWRIILNNTWAFFIVFEYTFPISWKVSFFFYFLNIGKNIILTLIIAQIFSSLFLRDVFNRNLTSRSLLMLKCKIIRRIILFRFLIYFSFNIRLFLTFLKHISNSML